MSRPRVLLADDHRMLTDALKGVLEPRCEVVGSVGDGRALVEAADKLRPDIVVLDIAMPRLNGLEAARQIRARMPAVKLIFMTMHEDPYLVGEAFRAGGLRISAEGGRGVRADRCARPGIEGRYLRDAQRRRRFGKYLVARPQGPGPSPGTLSPAAGSDSTAGRGAFHERSSRRFAYHAANRGRAQVRRHGTPATEDERRISPVRHKAPDHLHLKGQPAFYRTVSFTRRHHR